MTIDDSVQLLSKRFSQFPQSVNHDVDNKGNDFCEVCLQNGKNPMFPVTITVKEAGCLISVGRVQNVTGTACVPVENIIPAIEDIVNGRVIFVFGYANDEKLQDDRPFLTKIFALTGKEDDMTGEYRKLIEKINKPVSGIKRKLTNLKGIFRVYNFTFSVNDTFRR